MCRHKDEKIAPAGVELIPKPVSVFSVNGSGFLLKTEMTMSETVLFIK
jgi:hypothetical protein